VRSRLIAVPAVACLVLAGCGAEEPAAPPAQTVRLTVEEPADSATVREEAVEVRGRVDPADARVLVGGRPAEVAGGRFFLPVELGAGTNVVDVLASAPGARPAMTALRIRRQTIVRIPEVAGQAPEEARARLAALGLDVEVEEERGLLDGLLRGEPEACGTDPPEDEEVDAGTTVVLSVSKRC
jgi:hypothetical protein